MKLKYYIQTGVVALAAATVGVSCTDTWDDHYSVNGTVPGATLWENMQLDESIRPFVRVLEDVYKRQRMSRVILWDVSTRC